MRYNWVAVQVNLMRVFNGISILKCTIISSVVLIFFPVFLFLINLDFHQIENKILFLEIIFLGVILICFTYGFVFINNDPKINGLLQYKYFVVLMSAYGIIVQLFSVNPARIGLPYGHIGDFFQLIILSFENNFNEVSSIGYLPGVLSLSKLISLLFTSAPSGSITDLQPYVLYFVIFEVCLILTIILLVEETKSDIIALLVILHLTYPILLDLERGNWVNFSMLLFACSLSHKVKHINVPALSLSAVFKVLNIPFAMILIFSEGFKKTTFAIFLFIFGVLVPTALSIYYNMSFSYGKLFYSITSNQVFSDNHIAAAHSGFYALLVMLQNAGYFNSVDRYSYLFILKLCLIISLLLLYFLFYCEFFYFQKKADQYTLNYYLLAIFMALKLFHQNNTDMNYLLLFPILFPLCYREENIINRLIIALGLILTFNFVPFKLFSFSFTDYGGTWLYSFSVSSILYPSIMLLILGLFYYKRILNIRLH